MKRGFVALYLASLLIPSLFSQSSPSEIDDREVPPPPVVSALTASVSGNSVALEWISAPDIAGESIILRFSKPITSANFSQADVVTTIPYEQTSYTDTIASGADYYYAIMSRDADGTAYEFFLPASNALIVAITSEIKEEAPDTARIASFAAIAREDSVVLSWRSETRGRSLILYRSTSPFTSMNSLLGSVVVSSFADTGGPYIDYPVPGVPNYYALLDEYEVQTGMTVMKNGVNTNEIPVEVSAEIANKRRPSLPALRPMPLPLLNPSQSIETVPPVFSRETERKIDALAVTASKQIPERKPYIFRSDLEEGVVGEEYALRVILDGSFKKLDWNTAAKELKAFLSMRRSAQYSAKAHFYLGEAYYFTGNYQNALLEFLLSRDQYENQSREWIQYSLEAMVP